MDTILATEFGIHAVDLVAEQRFDSMVALHGTRIEPVPLGDVVSAGSARVDPDEERAHTAVGGDLHGGPLSAPTLPIGLRDNCHTGAVGLPARIGPDWQ
ncbi:MAG: hypothetical protein R2716_10695 [Microthrixaceae bacterium]